MCQLRWIIIIILIIYYYYYYYYSYWWRMLLGGLSQVKQSRLHQLVDWCGGSAEFDGCLVFDECHKAKHFVPVGYSYHHHLKLWPYSKQIWKIVTFNLLRSGLANLYIRVGVPSSSCAGIGWRQKFLGFPHSGKSGELCCDWNVRELLEFCRRIDVFICFC